MTSYWCHIFMIGLKVAHLKCYISTCISWYRLLFYFFFYRTLSDYVLIHSGLKTQLGILPSFAVYEASDESFTPWCNQRASLILAEVQTRRGNSACVVGRLRANCKKKCKNDIHIAFAIHLVILALQFAIIAAIKWPRLILF